MWLARNTVAELRLSIATAKQALAPFGRKNARATRTVAQIACRATKVGSVVELELLPGPQTVHKTRQPQSQFGGARDSGSISRSSDLTDRRPRLTR